MISGKISINLESVSEKIVGALAGIFATDHRRALVLGVGSGATAGSVGLLFDEVEAVEISGVILENIRRMEDYNFGLADMTNVSLVHDDAVHSVKVGQDQYSLILNTVTSPLFFSSSKLYTVEFLDHVRQRLAPGGLYVTWLDSRVGDHGANIMIETVTRGFNHCGLAQVSWSYLLLYVLGPTDHCASSLSSDPAGAAVRLPARRTRNRPGKPSLPSAQCRRRDFTKPRGRACQHPRHAGARIRNGATHCPRPRGAIRSESWENINPAELASAFRHFDWSLASMVEALPHIVGTNPYYQDHYLSNWMKRVDILVVFSRLWRPGTVTGSSKMRQAPPYSMPK